MRALLRRIGAIADRHAVACRFIALAGIVALIAALSISAERQNARINRVYGDGVHDGVRKMIFWHIDDAVEAAVRESAEGRNRR